MSVPSPAAADRGAGPTPALQVVARAMLLGLCTATLAWTLVRRHGQPSPRPA